MSASFRFILLFCAVLCGGFWGILGDSYARIDEPESYSGTSAITIFVSAIFAAPFWIPAIIPSRYSVALELSRRVSAVPVLLYTFLFGSILWHNVSRMISGYDASGEAFGVGTALTLTCISSLFILLRPELRS